MRELNEGKDSLSHKWSEQSVEKNKPMLLPHTLHKN